MEVILQRGQKEEESIPASHLSRQEVTPWGRTSPLPPRCPHTLNSKCRVRCNHSGCRSCQSTFWLKKQRTSLRFALQLLPHVLNVTRQGRRTSNEVIKAYFSSACSLTPHKKYTSPWTSWLKIHRGAPAQNSRASWSSAGFTTATLRISEYGLCLHNISINRANQHHFLYFCIE